MRDDELPGLDEEIELLEEEKPSSIQLYERLGGEAGIRAIVADFYDRVVADERLQRYFTSIDMQALREHQRLFVSFATGGPDFYTGQSLTQSHEGLKILPSHFDLMLEHLAAAMKASSVPEDDIQQVMGILRPLRERLTVSETT